MGMVHALKEAYRILIPGGIMIDVRPLSVDVPLEIIYKGGMDSAGIIDMSPGVPLDIAADQAIASVVKYREFVESKVEFFDFAFYWKNLDDMQDYMNEFWKEDVIVPVEAVHQARILLDNPHPKTQIRVGLQMKLAKYEKR
jgi:hypothetical protein